MNCLACHAYFVSDCLVCHAFLVIDCLTCHVLSGTESLTLREVKNWMPKINFKPSNKETKDYFEEVGHRLIRVGVTCALTFGYVCRPASSGRM